MAAAGPCSGLGPGAAGSSWKRGWAAPGRLPGSPCGPSSVSWCLQGPRGSSRGSARGAVAPQRRRHRHPQGRPRLGTRPLLGVQGSAPGQLQRVELGGAQRALGQCRPRALLPSAAAALLPRTGKDGRKGRPSPGTLGLLPKEQQSFRSFPNCKVLKHAHKVSAPAVQVAPTRALTTHRTSSHQEPQPCSFSVLTEPSVLAETGEAEGFCERSHEPAPFPGIEELPLQWDTAPPTLPSALGGAAGRERAPYKACRVHQLCSGMQIQSAPSLL